MRRLSTLSLVALMLLASLWSDAWQPVSSAAAADYDIPNGHFYTQANGEGGPSTGRGYAVTDTGLDDQGHTIKFWSEFQRLGGVAKLGYPASRRFKWDGFWSQATQRVIMQWRPEVQQVYFVNIFDKLHDLGKDPALKASRQVPFHESPNDAGKPFDQVIAERLSWLSPNPSMLAYYNSIDRSIALQLFGLPTSHIDNTNPNFDIIRLQRIVIQYWKVNVPGVANTGDITVGLGGDIAKEQGVLPGSPLTVTPEQPYAIDITNPDCLPYNPNNLTIVNVGTAGWQLRSGNSIMALLDNQQDAQNALAVAKRFTQQCFIGRGNSRTNRLEYIVQYFTGYTGQTPLISNQDCIGYDPSNLTIANLGATGWQLRSGNLAMLILDTQQDALKAQALARANTQQCFIGRSNTRANRYQYIFEYWLRS